MERVRKSLKVRSWRKVITYFLACCMFLNTSLPAAMAGPTGGVVDTTNGGAAEILYGQGIYEHTTQVNVATTRTIINWESLDTLGDAIADRETLAFSQGGLTDSAVLNRVSGDMTHFGGDLSAPGMRIFMVNPAGIMFDGGSTVNVTQLVASGLRMSDTDFGNAIDNPAQKMVFSSGSGDVTNNGTITATDSVYLVGEDVINNGAILCPGGLVVMAASDATLRLGQPGSSVIVDISAGDLNADSGNDLTNNGTIGEVGSPVGELVLASGDVFSQAITNVGDLAVVANEYVEFNGDIDVTGSLEVLSGQSTSADNMYINANITAGSIRLKNGNDTVGEETYSRTVVADGKNLTATDGDVVVESVHDIILGGNVSATGDIFLNADEDGYGDPRGESGVSYFPDPYGGGEVIANGTITAGDDVVIKANGIRFEDDVTATSGDLTIIGRLSREPMGNTLINDGSWGEIQVADGKTLSAGQDVSIIDSGDPAPGMMSLTREESLTIVAGTNPEVINGQIIVDNTTIEIAEGIAGVTSLTLEQDLSLDLADEQWELLNQSQTDLTLISNNGSVTAVEIVEAGGHWENAADEWASVGATADMGITLSGDQGNITTRQLTSTTGDIDVNAKDGQLLANESIEATAGSVILTAADGIDADGDITAGTDISLNSSTEAAGDLLAGNDIMINEDITLNGGDWVLTNGQWSWQDGDQSITASDGTVTAESWIWKETPGELHIYGGNPDLAIDLQYPGDLAEEDAAVATAGNLYILGNGDVQISGDVTALGGEYWGSPDLPEIQEGESVIEPAAVGGVSIVSQNGKIYTEDDVDNDTINVAIEGYSDDSEAIGIDLPYGDGKAAIVLMSNDDLKVGEDAELLAEGIYDAASVDDRAGVDFLVDSADSDPPGRNPGVPIDVAIYLASSAGNVHVGSPVSIESEGTGAMVVDAYDTVNFGSLFEDSLEGIVWLEVCSRRTGSLNEAIVYGTLPYADGSGSEAGYVLRGEKTDVGTGAWVLDAILPIAVPDFARTPIDIPVVRLDVLINDDTGEFPPVTVTLDSPTSEHGGTVTLNLDGTVNYEPPADLSGLKFNENGEATDTFTYSITDASEMTSESTTVTITLINTLPAPLYIPYISAAPGLEREVIEISGCPALVKWVASELGTDERMIQIWVANSLASGRDIQSCDTCASLKRAATVLQDVDGTRVAALAQVINEFASSTAPPTEEQMASIADAIANDVEGNRQYAAAGEYLDALAKYVGILNSEMGFSADESIQFATDNYVGQLADGENAGVAAYVAARLAALGGS